MIVRNACIITLDTANRVIDPGAVEVCADGSIGWVRRDLSAAELQTRYAGQEIVDASGKLLMPALINAHTHLYSTLARGIALRGSAPRNFPEILKRIWWRLDKALDEQDIYYSALIGLIDSAKSGVATLIDHHSSPNACRGSLDVIARAFREVGMRGALCYETSDRNGRASGREGIDENVRFLEGVRRQGNGDAMLKGTFGLHASFTLSDATLRQCLEANQTLAAGFHIHVAEDLSDVRHAQGRFHKSPVRRLCDLGVLDERSLAAHCVHVSAADVGCLAAHGVNVIHNPQSNCNNAVGSADITNLVRRSVMVGLGSDGYSPRIWEEFMAAFHVQKLRARDPRAGYSEAYAAALLNNRAIARKIWGWELGRIERGARADLMLVDYYAPTPLTGDNLFGHILFGIAHAGVDSLIVNGKFVLRDHRCVTMDERAVSEKATALARKLWARW
jgi:putative selenium metabolism protein SsnA